MGSCCAHGYEKLFGSKQARRDADSYRRNGLDETAQQLVDELAARDLAGASSLDVGGGVGGLTLELLRRGATSGTVVELSHGYDEEAAKLARDAGAHEQIERRYGDFVEQEALVEPADVVVLHRVVCCYPDPERLVGAAGRQTRRLLALSFPRDTWWVRLGVRVMNVWFRLTGGIETFVHDPARVVRSAEAAGLRTVLHERSTRIWGIAVFERP